MLEKNMADKTTTYIAGNTLSSLLPSKEGKIKLHYANLQCFWCKGKEDEKREVLKN